jgi:hypothetical protein
MDDDNRSHIRPGKKCPGFLLFLRPALFAHAQERAAREDRLAACIMSRASAASTFRTPAWPRVECPRAALTPAAEGLTLPPDCSVLFRHCYFRTKKRATVAQSMLVPGADCFFVVIYKPALRLCRASPCRGPLTDVLHCSLQSKSATRACAFDQQAGFGWSRGRRIGGRKEAQRGFDKTNQSHRTKRTEPKPIVTNRTEPKPTGTR